MRPTILPLLVLVLVLVMAPFLAATALAAPDDERARLAAQRQELTEGFAAEEAACRGRFVVTPCVDEVRARRRQALAPLRARELAIDDQQRRERAQQRQVAREARMARAAQAQAAAAAAPAGPASAAAAAQPARVAPAMRNHAGEAAARAAQAAERAQALVKRKQEAQQSQADIARRLEERKAAGKKSEPLPPPDLASTAKR